MRMPVRTWFEEGPDGRSPYRVFLPIGILVAVAMAMLFGLLWLGAERQDQAARDRSIELVQRIVDDAVRQMAREAKDYGWWNEAVRALVLGRDLDWADDNVGRYIYDSFDFDATFVIDGTGRTIYATVDGERSDAGAFELLSHGLEQLIQETSRRSAPFEPMPAGGLLSRGGEVVLAGVSLIIPEREGEIELPEGAPTVLVFTRRLDGDYWAEFADRYALEGFRVVPAGSAELMLPLRAANGELLGGLAWHPPRPGAVFLRSFLPAVAIATVVVAVLTVMVLRGATRALAESEARFRDVADAGSDWIWEVDREHRLRFASHRFKDEAGLAAGAFTGRPLTEILRPIEDEGGNRSVGDALDSGRPFRNILCRMSDRQGAERILRIAGKPILTGSGVLTGYRGTATDATREVEAEAKVRYLALHDALTGLPNRTALGERLEPALAAARRTGAPAAVICIDIDRFKEVNDTLGHSAGDLLIRRCGERLLGCVRKVDTVARLGGDEFAIIQVGIGEVTDVYALCERILASMAEPVDLDGSAAVVTASIGVAMVPEDGDDPGRLLQRADIALYRSKEEGRNGFRFFEPEMNARLQARKALEQDLRGALEHGEFELHFQPQIELADGRWVGVEALLRWRHAGRGQVAPAEFIPVAEDSGLIVPIGEWVLREACRRAAGWPDLVVSVNLSPVQFRRDGFLGTVCQALKESGLDPTRLELEITEGVLLRDSDTALRTLRELRALGTKITMDDFGTGYSSLSLLHMYPFDKIKIDRAFIAHLDEGGHARAIMEAVIGLGRSLRLRTCAEGVETEAQYAFLVERGCDEAQGHHFSEPLPAELVADRFLSASRKPAYKRQYAASA
jgi:diguanylate cyclase (GGDEF)-like protein/PAS domain S-box-containing protein